MPTQEHLLPEAMLLAGRKGNMTNSISENTSVPDGAINDGLSVRFFEALLQWDKRICLEHGEVPSDVRRTGMMALGGFGISPQDPRDFLYLINVRCRNMTIHPDANRLCGQLIYTFADCGIGLEFPSDRLTPDELEANILRKARNQRIDMFVHSDDSARVIRIDRDLTFNKTLGKIVAPIRDAVAGVINSRSRLGTGFKRDERIQYLRASIENASPREKACTQSPAC